MKCIPVNSHETSLFILLLRNDIMLSVNRNLIVHPLPKGKALALSVYFTTADNVTMGFVLNVCCIGHVHGKFSRVKTGNKFLVSLAGHH